MPKGSLNVSLKGADDIFSTEESRQEQQREQVQQIPIGELFPFKNHPFKVLDDESMQRTVESVEQYGVLSPLIARPRPDGDGYEIISGHRRQYAAKLAGLETLPVIVRNMDDDAAVLLMVDSNLQRETILPSERAFAYKMKLEAILCPVCTLWICWWACAAVQGYGWRSICVAKTPKSTVTAWSTALPGGVHNSKCK